MGTSFLLQPLDQGIIAAIKAYYLSLTFQMLTNATQGSHVGLLILLKLTEFWKKYKNAVDDLVDFCNKEFHLDFCKAISKSRI